MDKLTELTDVNKYWCSECLYFHIRKYKYKINKFGIRVKTKDTPFFNHKEYANKLSASEMFKLRFNRSSKHYSIKSHKKTVGSRKQ